MSTRRIEKPTEEEQALHDGELALRWWIAFLATEGQDEARLELIRKLRVSKDRLRKMQQ